MLWWIYKSTPAKMTIRLGAISFINTLPVYARFQSWCTTDVIYAAPSILNSMISAGELDISPVSSAHYLQHQDDLVLLPGLSVSSFGAVKSVLVLSQTPLPPEANTRPTIAIPDDSATSVALLRWYLAQHQCPESNTPVYPAEQYEHAIDQYGAVLMIGDRALAASQHSSVLYIADLSSVWVTETGLPFVFAVWVARKTWIKFYPDETKEILKGLCNSRDSVLTNPAMLRQVISQAESLSGLSSSVILDYYLNALNYDWTPAHQQSLYQFKQVLAAINKSQNSLTAPLPPG